MSKEEDVKFLKIQTCILKVNIHCEGCKQKVKKLLQKIDGVYTTTVDAEQGKVTVSGNVDPSILIKKLQKNGKPAELWGSKGDKNQLNNQGKGQKDGNPQKGGQEQKGKNQQSQPQQQQQLQLPQMKGLQDLNLPQFNGLNLAPPNGSKAVQFILPDDDADAAGSDDFDDEFDEDGEFDELDDEYVELMKKMKLPMGGNGMMMKPAPMNGNDMMMMMMGNGLPPLMNAPQAMDGKNGGGHGQKGGGADVNVQQNKVMGGASDAKNGKGRQKGGGNNGGGNQNQGGGGAPKNGGKNGGPQDGKNGGNSGGGNNKNANNGASGGGGADKNGASGKKGGSGGANNAVGQAMHMAQGLPNFNPMGQMGGQMGHQMGQMGNGPAQGLPSGLQAVNPSGYFRGAGPEIMAGNPYHQQQYAAAMMAQQRLNGDERFQATMYGRLQLPVAYYPLQHPPPPYNGYGYFSEENPAGCAVM